MPTNPGVTPSAPPIAPAAGHHHGVVARCAPCRRHRSIADAQSLDQFHTVRPEFAEMPVEGFRLRRVAAMFQGVLIAYGDPLPPLPRHASGSAPFQPRRVPCRACRFAYGRRSTDWRASAPCCAHGRTGAVLFSSLALAGRLARRLFDRIKRNARLVAQTGRVLTCGPCTLPAWTWPTIA